MPMETDRESTGVLSRSLNGAVINPNYSNFAVSSPILLILNEKSSKNVVWLADT